jgi:hypothetical protein
MESMLRAGDRRSPDGGTTVHAIVGPEGERAYP